MLPVAQGGLQQSLPPLTTNAFCIAISATSTATTAVPVPKAPGGRPGPSLVRVVNEGPSIAFLAFGNRGVTATLPTAAETNTCDAIGPGEDLIFSLAPGNMQVSAICRAGGTATLTLYRVDGQ